MDTIEQKYNYSQQRIIQEVFDTTQQALSVVLKNLAVELNLDHKTGDSVFAIKRSLAVKANIETDCSGYSQFCAFEPGQLFLSPSDEGNDFYAVAFTPGQVLNICARRLKCTVNCVIQG